MDKTLLLWYDNDGTAVAFPSASRQAELFDFSVSKSRMGNAPTITATLEWGSCLDDAWSAYGRFDDVYVEFAGERYRLKATPSSSKSNDKATYKHELSFVSERVVLEHVYVIDDTDTHAQGTVYSGSTQFTFFGTLLDFIAKLNTSMRFSDIGDSCIGVDNNPVGDGYFVTWDGVVTDDERLVTLSDSTVADALKKAYEAFGTPYYFKGRTIHFSDYEAVSETVQTYADNDGVVGASVSSGTAVPFEYGHPNSLLNISRSNGSKETYNRVSGTGSEDNIPFYYPNPTPTGTIHLELETQPGSTLTESDITIEDPVRFSELSDSDALVFKQATEDMLVELDGVSKLFRADNQHVMIIHGGVHGVSAQPFSMKYNYKTERRMVGIGSSMHLADFFMLLPTDIELLVEFTLGMDFKRLSLPFETEFADDTDWLLHNKDNSFVVSGTSRSVEYEGLVPEGKYYLHITKTYHSEYEGQWLAMSDSWGTYVNDTQDITALVTDTDTWKGWWGVNEICWSLQSTGNKVEPTDYGLSISTDHEIVIAPGDTITKVVDKWVLPQPKLMPECYRLSDGKERFYPAIDYPYPYPQSGIDEAIGEYAQNNYVHNDNYIAPGGSYYAFETPYERLRQSEHIEDFPDIKPTIEGVLNADGRRIDMFLDFAYDTDDNNDGHYDSEGNFVYDHPVFFALMRPTSGTYGFNLFDQAIDESQMSVSMTSGDCAPCEFKILVGEDTKKNLVQVDEDGNLLRDEYGDVRCGRTGKPEEVPQDEQNDTLGNAVWIALEKDKDTYGMMMPYSKDGTSIRPQACSDASYDDGDTFVILHIKMPEAYVTAAEHRLSLAITEWMHEHNREEFTMSMRLSRVFLAENPSLADLLSENIKVSTSYNGTTRQCYVSSYTYKMSASSPIPEIELGGLVEDVEKVSSARSSGGLTKTIANYVADNFDTLMSGYGKPYQRMMAANNTEVLAQARAQQPKDNVKGGSMTASSVVTSSQDGASVGTIPNGNEGQVLGIDNGVPSWISVGGVQVQSDWIDDDTTSPAHILNKPSIKAGTGVDSVIEGDLENNVASAYCSHAEGAGTQAYNDYEHAEGYHNVSHTVENSSFGNAGNTLSSIGFGSSNDRRNAVEVMQNGDVYVYGVGGYDGTNPSSEKKLQANLGGANLVSTTYSELKSLRDSGSLSPGVWYRITDYSFSTSQPNTISAGVDFDILVLATGGSSLDENALAARRQNLSYFQDCDLSAWRLKYSLDNDTDRFLWASSQGKGVIFYMKDEFNNEAHYDFKNAKFLRKPVLTYSALNDLVVDSVNNTYGFYYGAIDFNSQDILANATYGESEYFYTFSLYEVASGEFFDYSVVSAQKLLKDGHLIECRDNKIGTCYYRPQYGTGKLALNNVVVYSVYNHITQGDVSVATLCQGIELGNDCSSITLGCDSHDFRCGNNCFNFVLADYGYNSRCGNGCSGWQCGKNCHDWTCGNNSFEWLCGANCTNWSCGNNCDSWSCGNNCTSWSVGNSSYSWACGNDCSYWSCGNHSGNWSCGDNCNNWSVGDDCMNWAIGDDVSYLIADTGCGYWSLVSEMEGVFFQNVHILLGFKGSADNILDLCTLGIQEDAYTPQYIGFRTDGTVRVWNIADVGYST